MKQTWMIELEELQSKFHFCHLLPWVTWAMSLI